MSSDFPVYRHHSTALFVGLMVLLVFVGAVLFLSAAEIAFAKIGISSQAFLAILFLTLLGSMINIPVYRAKNIQNMVDEQEVRFYWRSFRIPRMVRREVSTLVTINMGGAIVPVIVTLYLLATHASVILDALCAAVITSIIIHLVARRVRGVGIVTPAFIPPVAAAIISLLLVHGANAAVVAYVSGTLGALIGADLTNLGGITKMGAPVVSIGGAGTFDGVFLTGIIAVLIVILFTL